MAVLIYFRRRILELARERSWSYAGKIVIGTIPAGLVGVLFESAIERTFADMGLLVLTLVVTGALLLSLNAIPRERSRREQSWAEWWIGCAADGSILPGISGPARRS